MSTKKRLPLHGPSHASSLPSLARSPSSSSPSKRKRRIRILAWMTTVFVLPMLLVQNVRLALREGAALAIPTAATIQINLYWQSNATAFGAAKTTVLDLATPTMDTTTMTAETTTSPLHAPSVPAGADSANRSQSSAAGASTSPIVYSILRPDRSGAVILDMLFAHAHAYSKNLTYGGACDLAGSSSSSSRESGIGNENNTRPTPKEDAKDLVRAVGLENVLRFACPPDANGTFAESIMKPKTYLKRNLADFTSQYLRHVRSQVRYPPHQHGKAVVHVRRGDVTPCSYYSNRYLPNAHYVDILHEMVPRNASVTILSESDAFESPEKDFAGHELLLDSDLSAAWLAMMTADHVVLSRSSFSFVPALLNPVGKVYYTPFLKPKLPGWITVPKSIQKRSRERVRAMIHQRCTNETVKRLALRRLDK